MLLILRLLFLRLALLVALWVEVLHWRMDLREPHCHWRGFPFLLLGATFPMQPGWYMFGWVSGFHIY
ncbi:hypothetical protein BC941DRAFT_186694 [Chlamydoabsidia padenii]|nr:hypothetical protein BC941DRAFT_186694 [Chlamydoabsidia padenii]